VDKQSSSHALTRPPTCVASFSCSPGHHFSESPPLATRLNRQLCPFHQLMLQPGCSRNRPDDVTV
ncbi:unnamed protein product, partial [Protopolystoma xenopodis]